MLSVCGLNNNDTKLSINSIQQDWIECYDALNNNTITVSEAIQQLHLVCIDKATIDAYTTSQFCTIWVKVCEHFRY